MCENTACTLLDLTFTKSPMLTLGPKMYNSKLILDTILRSVSGKSQEDLTHAL